MTASLQEIEDLERKKADIERRLAQMKAEDLATPVIPDTGAAKPSATRFGKAPDEVPPYEREY